MRLQAVITYGNKNILKVEARNSNSSILSPKNITYEVLINFNDKDGISSLFHRVPDIGIL